MPTRTIALKRFPRPGAEIATFFLFPRRPWARRHGAIMQGRPVIVVTRPAGHVPSPAAARWCVAR